jgi:alkyldihydroxyacetonephosphate synthase
MGESGGTSTYAVWGWGEPGEEPRAEALAALAPLFQAQLGFALQPPERPAPLPPLPPPRVTAPGPLAAIASDAPLDRARHAFGRSYRDLLRGLRGQLDHPPDLVLRPRSEAEVSAALDWCSEAGVALVPFGGGTSVVGGVEPAVAVGEGGFAGVVSLDLAALAGVTDVDQSARAARVLAGTTGPALERALARHGLTLRFYPQSFERSTAGGWLATRAAGHFATGATHIDDLVESIRLLTPAGVSESRRLPASGAGPSPDRLALGSEGTLGVITAAWLRVQPRPARRARATVAFPTFGAGAAAVRAILQAGLAPANCRLVDAAEAAVTGSLATGEALLLLGFEAISPDLPIDAELAVALELSAQLGGHVHSSAAVDSRVQDPSADARVRRGGGAAAPWDAQSRADGAVGPEAPDAAGAWRSAFLRAPYLREYLVLLGALAETFETAVTWDRLDALVAGVREAVGDALRRVCGGGTVTCRLTHAYRDGAAPYFTVLAPARRGSELAQWAEVKAAAAEAVLAHGGTITHHHAVGRDHRPWYDRQRPAPFAHALRAAKAALDPAGILNPGVLLDR